MTKGDIHSLAENPAWKEVLARAKNMMDVADAKVENESLFNQGYFNGTRKLYNALVAMPQTMLDELDGKAGTVKMR